MFDLIFRDLWTFLGFSFLFLIVVGFLAYVIRYLTCDCDTLSKEIIRLNKKIDGNSNK